MCTVKNGEKLFISNLFTFIYLFCLQLQEILGVGPVSGGNLVNGEPRAEAACGNFTENWGISLIESKTSGCKSILKQ